jgi:multimeric flavodoxin WrbA
MLLIILNGVSHYRRKSMKVLLVNGSPKEKGCTYTALREVASALEQNGIEAEIMWLGKDAVNDCVGCGACAKLRNNRCVFDKDIVNRFLEKAEQCDGFVFGSPVYYAHANGRILSVLDRAFYAGSRIFALKPGAVVTSARRAGTTCALDDMMKYLTISNMFVVSSQYWNMVHGHTPDEVIKDEEGMQTMRVLGRNMSYLLKCLDAGKDIEKPEKERRIMTNFIS